MMVSPSRTMAMADTLRSTVGRDAAVPRKRTVRDMGGEYKRPRYVLRPRAATCGRVCNRRLAYVNSPYPRRTRGALALRCAGGYITDATLTHDRFVANRADGAAFAPTVRRPRRQ